MQVARCTDFIFPQSMDFEISAAQSVSKELPNCSEMVLHCVFLVKADIHLPSRVISVKIRWGKFQNFFVIGAMLVGY